MQRALPTLRQAGFEHDDVSTDHDVRGMEGARGALRSDPGRPPARPVPRNPGRGERLTVEAAGLYLDYSKNRVTDETLRLLLAAGRGVGPARADRRDVPRREDQRHREPRRAARRAARARAARRIVVDGEDVVPQVHEVLDRMADFADRVRSGEWKGHTGKRIRNVVNIGIGGSDLGPGDGLRGAAALQRPRHDVPLRLQRRRHRLRRGDARPRPRGDAVHRLVEDLHDAGDDDQRAHRARDWSLAALGGDASAVAKHFVAVSTNAEEVAEFGIDTANMFGFWDWVGGRYSMDSAIGLSTMLAIGPGATSARCSPASTRWTSTSAPRRSSENLPVLMGLLARLVRRLLRRADGRRAALRAVPEALPGLPAAARRWRATASACTLDGAPVDYETGPVYWGEPGTNGQHSFYQLIHQGTRPDPVRLHRLRRSR